MNKFRIAKQINYHHKNITYLIEERFLYVFWITIKTFYKEDEAVKFYNELTKELDYEQI